jgi:hypothetical protein
MVQRMITSDVEGRGWSLVEGVQQGSARLGDAEFIQRVFARSMWRAELRACR